MDETIRAISWEAPEHHHIEKGSDWFWMLGIVAIAGGAAAIAFGNILFGIVILLGAATMAVTALREPQELEFAVTTRGLQLGHQFYPYNALEAYCIDEEDPLGPQLLVRSEKLFMSLIIIPLPPDHIDDIDDILSTRLIEEEIQEPLSHKLMEMIGF